MFWVLVRSALLIGVTKMSWLNKSFAFQYLCSNANVSMICQSEPIAEAIDMELGQKEDRVLTRQP